MHVEGACCGAGNGTCIYIIYKGDPNIIISLHSIWSTAPILVLGLGLGLN